MNVHPDQPLPNTSTPPSPWLRNLLIGSALIVGVGCVVLAVQIIFPYWQSYQVKTANTSQLKLPDYDLSLWQAWPVQTNGRVMPMETAAINAVRQITGRAKFEGQPALAIFLSWMLTAGSSSTDGLTDWENYPFLLCEDHQLRTLIFRDALKGEEPTPEQIHGKYLAPSQVRNSAAFRQLLMQVMRKREIDPQKAEQIMEPIERKAQELQSRLVHFDSITQGDPQTSSSMGHRKPEDQLQIVALDQIPLSPWFSLGQLREFITRPDLWQEEMFRRVTATPDLYLKPANQEELRVFQQHVAQGREKELLDQLQRLLNERTESAIARFREEAAKDSQKARSIAQSIVVSQLLRKEGDHQEFQKRLEQLPADRLKSDDRLAVFAEEMRLFLTERNKQWIDELAQEARKARQVGYVPAKDEFRMLHMRYMEALHPRLYIEAATWQEFPQGAAEQIHNAFAQLQQAYRAGPPEEFHKQAKAYHDLIEKVSKQYAPDYPHERYLGLELTFNRVEPFKWAWVTMALSVLFFAISLGTTSRIPYGLGWLMFAGSMGFQVFGYYTRTIISGRAPVTNMYETVIFVASMAAVFACLLELIYRRRFIILSGTVVATLGLVLADQLPVNRGFDSQISPLAPVLRSNYWLIIHVMTIVASYAAGALAWGMGNLVLGLYMFGSPNNQQIKQLSQFAYRAMQIAVLLLAAGTFLGGWWAAESWGRFWGWDPKETWALIALIAYIIPLHARYIGWVKDFGLAVSAVVCFAAIVMSWYGVNFILGAGLHSYGFGGGGPWYVFLACLINLEWVILASLRHLRLKSLAATPAAEATIG